MMKRGGMNFMMVMLIVILALAAILLVFAGRVGKSTSDTINSAAPSAIKAQIQSCRLTGLGFQDSDGDKLADYCDPCHGGNDFKQQKDADLLADPCDESDLTDKSAFYACCGSDPKGKTIEELKANCKSGRLIAVEPYFQCSSKT